MPHVSRDVRRRRPVLMPVGVIPVGVIVVIALLARLVPVLRGGGLTGVLAYDDGVYYSASDALLSGRLPYRDYLLLHPPGHHAGPGPVRSPRAGVRRPGRAGRRPGSHSCWSATACAVLVWVVARRLSPLAGLAAGLLYAVWQPAAYAERTTLLEPLVNLGSARRARPARRRRQPSPGGPRRCRARARRRGEGVGDRAVRRARGLAAGPPWLARLGRVHRRRGRRGLGPLPAVPGGRRPTTGPRWWCSTSSAGRTTGSRW